MKKTLFLILIFGIEYSTAQVRIPFTLNKQSNICIKTQINEADSLVLMFHSSFSGITLIEKALQKVKLKEAKETDVKTWGGNAKAEFYEGNSMKIGNQKWENQTIFINENSGDNTDGKFGFDLFEDKIIEIDYDQKFFIIHEKIPRKVKKFKKIASKIDKNGVFIEGNLKVKDKILTDKFMFHTGYGSSILLDPKIGEEFEMNLLKTISTSELRDSYNNVFKIDTKELPEITIGEVSQQNIPLSFTARPSQFPLKVFGNDLLKRFNVIFDLQKKEVYLKPNTLKDLPFSVKK